MHSISHSREEKEKRGHVDLDQKHSDSVFYDAEYMPDLRDSKRNRRRLKSGTSRPNQTKAQRKRVYEQKKLFMEISKDGKLSDKKSTLSREERKVKRQLFIMENLRNKTAMLIPKVKPKKSKRAFQVNHKFDLGTRRSPKTFLQWYWDKEIPVTETKLELESQNEEEEELNLSDREDVRESCNHYFNLKTNGKKKKRMEIGKTKKHQQDLKTNSNASIDNLIEEQSNRNLVLDKRNFNNAFVSEKKIQEHKLQIESEDKVDSLEKLEFGKKVNGSESTESSNEVFKKTLAEGVVCLDLTQHFRKYPLITPTN